MSTLELAQKTEARTEAGIFLPQNHTEYCQKIHDIQALQQLGREFLIVLRLGPDFTEGEDSKTITKCAKKYFEGVDITSDGIALSSLHTQILGYGYRGRRIIAYQHPDDLETDFAEDGSYELFHHLKRSKYDRAVTRIKAAPDQIMLSYVGP